MTFVFWLAIAFMALASYLLGRNEAVFIYRKAMIKDIGRGNRADIGREYSQSIDLEYLESLDFEWRWREYDAVSYQKILYTFWKPVDSFYAQDPTREVR